MTADYHTEGDEEVKHYCDMKSRVEGLRLKLHKILIFKPDFVFETTFRTQCTGL